MKLAVVFPGQGSQSVGMGRDWLEHPAARQVFNDADYALDFQVSEMCFNGPEDELKLTANLQPAILTMSFAVFQAIRDELPPPSFYAGHSLGEYTSLVAAGSLMFADAVATVRERGRLMQEAVPPEKGRMVAVVGLDAEIISEINHQIISGLNMVLDIANFNSPEQIVVSGDSAAVTLAMSQYEEAGAKHVVELAVSAPFHSALMVPAANGLRPRLEAIEFTRPDVPVIANLTAQPYPSDTAQYPLLLHAQIFNPVRWTETVQYMAARDVTHLLEVGPGKVLRMLAAKTTSRINGFNIEKADQLGKLKEWLAEVREA